MPPGGIVSQRENGIVIGTVVDLNDPEKLGRVKLKLPQYNDEQSTWARIASPMAGGNRGFFFRPEVQDEVLVGFENGEVRRPYVLGALWSKVDTPPPRDSDDTKNNWRFIVSRSGHILKFDDTSGAEKIEIIDKSGSLKITLDSANSKIQIESNGDVEVSAPQGTFKVSAQTVDIEATGQMTLQATGTMTLQGSIVNIN
jgi:uncharacterized protein involved in type VI secretion and phage assembly